jgi:phosphoribosylformylglycinamidine synthase
LVDAIDRVLSLPSVASKSFLITIGDRTITGMVNRDQMVGPWQVPVADAAVTANSYLGFRGEAMAMGERSPVALFDAAASGRMAISEALTNIMSADIKSIGDVKLSANWMVAAGYASEDAKLYQTVQAVAMDLCPKLGVCIPVGKDSMSMRTVWKDKEDSLESSNTAPLSLVVTAFGCVEDIRRTLTPELDNSADTHLFLIDLSRGKNRLGGSALGQVFRSFEGPVADLDSPEELIQMFKFIQLCRQRGLLLAYHDRSDGGVLTTLFEMAFASHVGLDITLREDLNEQKLIESLFAEELGAVIQVKSEDYDEVFEIADSLGMADSLESIASIRDDDFIKIYSGVREVFTSSRIDLHRIWAQTSYKLQCLRDNSACAKEEFDALLDPDDPGLTVKSSFDLNVDIAAPYINVGSKPRVAILREQGVNGQLEMGAAFDRAHFESVDVHMTDLIAGRQTLGNFNLFAACGGFSYGDVLGAGGGWAKTILFNGSLRDQFASFFDRKDTLAFGVCNGCQMMSHLTELIPGTENWPKFFRNKSEQFEGRFSLIKVDGDSSVFFNGMKGSQFPIAVAHGEGKAVFDSEETASALKQSGNITLRYIDNYGEIAEQYPANPNGSIDGIAGVCNDDGRVSIMMPHPERVFRASQNSWHPNSWRDDAPSMRIFRNARVWFD